VVAQPHRLGLIFGDGLSVVVERFSPGKPAVAHLPLGRFGLFHQGERLVANFLDVVRHLGRLAHGGRIETRFTHVGIVQPGQGKDDPEIHVGQRPLDGIAAFEHGDVRGKQFGQAGIALGRKGHVRDGVGKMIVLAGGINDEVGLEVANERQDEMFHDVEETFVRGTGRQRHVDGPSERRGAAHLLRKARAGIERSPVLMQGNKQGVRVVPVDVLGPVAVMAVRIHDGHAQGAEVLAQPLDHDRFDIDVAKTARAVDHFHGVVSGGTHQGEGPAGFLVADQPAGPDGATGRDEMRRRGHGGDIGKAEMHPGHVGGRGQVGLDLGDAGDVEDALLPQLVLGVEQALLAFGMGGGDGPVEGRKEHDPQRTGGLQHAEDTAFL